MSRLLGRRHDHERGQDGYVLLAVLAAIAVTALTIGALFGLMLSTLHITAAQEKSARESRAADGAVTAAINNVRLHQTNPLDSCSPGVPAGTGLVVPFDGVGGTDNVKVTCAAAPDQLGPSGGDVDLVGDGYKGIISDWRTSWPWAAVPVPAATVAATDPSLIHTGDAPVLFNGTLTANKGIAAVRSQTGATPAVNVRAGSALQPVAGLGGTGTSCGVLDGAGVQPQTAVVATSGVTCGDSALVPEIADQNYGTNPTPQTPTATCPGTAVVELQPGTYDRDAVATLNTWFNGSVASCKGKTFHFNTGIYSFDANARTGAAADRFALIFNDATASFVFGTPNGWGATGATAVNFPRACVPGGPGSSIVISARTEFRHLAGRIAVCPYTSAEGKAWPALLQSRSVPTTVSVNTPTSTDFANPAGLLSGASTTAATRNMFCTVPFLQWRCVASAAFSVKLATSATGPVTSVPFRVTGDETNYNVTLMAGRTAAFNVTLANGLTCTVPEVDGAPDDSRTAAYELMLASGTCDTAITDASLLDGATVQLVYRYSYVVFPPCGATNGCWIPSPQTLTIWQIGVAINTWQGVGGPDDVSGTHVVGTPAAGWWSVGNIRLDDTLVAEVEICPNLATWCFPPVGSYDRSVVLSKVSDPPGSPNSLAPVASVNSIGVLIRQVGDRVAQVNTATLRGTTTLTLTLADHTVCTRTTPGINNMAGDTYYSLLDLGSANCGGSSLSAAQLTGANVLGSSLQLSYHFECAADPLVNGLCLFVEPVKVQHVALVATTDTYTGPVTQSQLNIDSATGKSANFFGPAFLPHTALDIFWKGTASNASIFGGDLQLYSLGSRMTAGATADVVCCTAPSATVRRMVLTAQIDGRARVSATVSINRTTGELEVLEWIRCGRNGASATSP